MSEQEDNVTIAGYLGPEFQAKLIWQLLVEPEFAEKIMPLLSVDYFDDSKTKRFFIVLSEYLKEFEKPANLQNQSINLAIQKFKSTVDPLDEEYLDGILKRAKYWNERVINKDLVNDGDVVQKETFFFIQQQEIRKTNDYINYKLKSGEYRQKNTFSTIMESFGKIADIGSDEDFGTGIIENIDCALRIDFREPIPTGISAIDLVTENGLGKGEVGIILSPSGVGKSSTLTKIANSGFEHGKKILQIIFEDTEDQIKRKHYTIWSKIPLDEIDNNTELVKKRVFEHFDELKSTGDLIIKKFSDDGTTILDVRRWIDRYQKKYNVKFDMIVLDYLDCLESHKKSADQNQSELYIIKSFISMASDYNIPCWSALQTGRQGLDAEWVETHMMGGSIKRLQKSHFVMSIAKTAEQREGGELANIKILKSRFASDGHMFKDCIFNNKTLEIRITDPKWISKEKMKSKEPLLEIDNKVDEILLKSGISNYDENNYDSENTNNVMKKIVEKNAFLNNLILNEDSTEDINKVENIEDNDKIKNIKANDNNTTNEDKILEIDENKKVEKVNISEIITIEQKIEYLKNLGFNITDEEDLYLYDDQFKTESKSENKIEDKNFEEQTTEIKPEIITSTNEEKIKHLQNLGFNITDEEDLYLYEDEFKSEIKSEDKKLENIKTEIVTPTNENKTLTNGEKILKLKEMGFNATEEDLYLYEDQFKIETKSENKIVKKEIVKEEIKKPDEIKQETKPKIEPEIIKTKEIKNGLTLEEKIKKLEKLGFIDIDEDSIHMFESYLENNTS